MVNFHELSGSLGMIVSSDLIEYFSTINVSCSAWMIDMF